MFSKYRGAIPNIMFNSTPGVVQYAPDILINTDLCALSSLSAKLLFSVSLCAHTLDPYEPIELIVWLWYNLICFIVSPNLVVAIVVILLTNLIILFFVAFVC